MSRGTRQPHAAVQTTVTRREGVQVIVGLVLVAIAFAFILGLSLNASPERQAMAMEEQRAVLPYRIASRITGYVVWGVGVKVAAFVLLGYGAFYLLAIARNWLDLRARQVHARDGLFPVVQLAPGVLYDPNRDNAGAHPLITMAALGVQKQVATQADRLIIRQVDRPQLPQGEADALPAPLTPDPLPALVRLAEVAPRPTLEALTLGIGAQGVIAASLYDLMHVLAVGASGFGKSAFLRALIWQLAQAPEPVSVVGIDCFGSELNVIGEWNKLLFPVAKELPQAMATLQAVTAEIARRKTLYARQPQAFDLPSYNRLTGEPLTPVVLLVDEGTAMLNEPGIADPLRQVVQTARQFGVYALLAGQNVNHKVMPTQTRDNFSTRLCFHTSAASRHVVLGETTDDVTIKGRAWVQRPGEMLQQIQTPFVTRDEVAQVITVGKPQRIVEVASRPVVDSEDVAARIKALHADGVSLNKIQQQVFGYTGGKAYSTVKQVLG